jgi:hypothetical protein
MTDWAALITAGGGTLGALTGLGGVLFGWRNRQANYAQATADIGSKAADIAGRVAADLREENAGLKTEVAGLKTEIRELDRKQDELRDVVFDMRGLLMRALVRLERAGDQEFAAEVYAALNRPRPL